MVAVALVKGAVSFADSHNAALMHDPNMVALRSKISVVADKALDDPAAPRGARVDVTTTDGRTLSHTTRFPPGTKENPLSVEGVNDKARDLMAPVLGKTRRSN
jgi:2-methylcitrate dehydratase PrpD